MQTIGQHLEKREFTIRQKPKSEAQEKAWDRADVAIEVCKWLYLPEVMQLIEGVRPERVIELIDYAKKHGEKPKNFFRYLVGQEKHK